MPTSAGVVPNEPADQAGLAKGDVITGLAGKAVTSATGLTSLLETHHPGDTVKSSPGSPPRDRSSRPQ